MNRVAGIVLLVVSLFVATAAVAQTAGDIQKHPGCTYCGMDRAQFAHSRVLVVYDDGSELGACSLHCAAVDLAVHIDKTPTSIQVADYGTKKLIEAEKANWVIGGNKPGVMTKRAKWAFENKADADNYIRENGGALGDFEEAMKATYQDMYADTRMIREKRAMKKQQMKGAEGHEHHPGMEHKEHQHKQ